MNEQMNPLKKTYSITKKDGSKVEHLCTIDVDKKIIISNEPELFINAEHDYTIIVGNSCNIRVGSRCTIKVGNDCEVKTMDYCVIDAGENCKITTDGNCVCKSGKKCTFRTDSDCAFKTGDFCKFKTDNSCTFNTGFACIFETGKNCMFHTSYKCTFTTEHDCMISSGPEGIFKVGKNCSLINRSVDDKNRVPDILPENITIMTNKFGAIGYKVNTKEWVKANMDDEKGLEVILTNDEFFDPSTLKV